MEQSLGKPTSSLTGLSEEQVKSLKGIFALVVLMHHLYQSTDIIDNRYLGAIFQALGFFAVSIFFFLSGYGLQMSYCIKKQDYIKVFLKKKVMPFYCVIILLIAIYWPARILMGEIVDPLNVVRSFFFGMTIISKGWYLQAQLFLYLLFLCVWHFIKNDSVKQVVLFSIVIVHTALCISFDVSITRYISLLGFVLGIFWADKRMDIFVQLEKKRIYILSVVFCLVAMAVTFGIWQLAGGWISIFSQGICQLLFVVFIILLTQKIQIVNSITMHLGVYSFEIYIVQGLFLNLYKSPILYINNDYVFAITVVLSTYFTALLIHPIINFIYLMFRRKQINK